MCLQSEKHGIAQRCRQFAAAPCGGLQLAEARAVPAASVEPHGYPNVIPLPPPKKNRYLRRLDLTIRPIRREEFPLLADFLYDAIYRSDPSSPLLRQIVEHPSLRIYIADFGTLPDDRCLVAQAEGHVVGMVWVRCIRAYGYIGEGIPEFVLSVAAPCRGQDIGTRLMREMLQRLSAAGYPEASLSVQRRNPAVRLYRRLGFRTVKRTLEEYIMACDLRDTDSAVANRTAGTE